MLITGYAQVSIVKILSPVKGDNWQSVQSAIDEVAAMPIQTNGFRGKILLKSGNYEISKTLRIFQSGIVLCGERHPNGRTILTATSPKRYNLLEVLGHDSLVIDKNSEANITCDYTPVGTKEVTIDKVQNFNIGDPILLHRDSSAKCIQDIAMDRIPPRKDGRKIEQWPAVVYFFDFERNITNIDGNTLTLDAPIVMAIERQYNSGKVWRVTANNRLSDIGIENIDMVSVYQGSEDENHGWTAIKMDFLENAWVRNVTSRHFGYSCVELGRQTRLIAVENCKYLEPVSKICGSRRYAFKLAGQQNLIMDCFADHARHAFLTDSRVRGPNVFYNCKAENCHNDTGPHHRWAMGILYDNVTVDSSLNVQDRSNLGSGHGWSGVNHVLWNCTAEYAAVQNPPGGQNWCIEFHGKREPGQFPGRPSDYWEGNNKKGLLPVSLFLAQKEATKLNNILSEQ
ncbi:MAG: hypothetical protein JXQ65_11060 [Candidatus Marinimicrobia bacterium]|nr:hypothetical protein [Candidatus Neomarinimicrobiota bacterium]